MSLSFRSALACLILAGLAAPSLAATPVGGFFVHMNQQNVTGFGDSRRSVTFYDADDFGVTNPSPLFSVHIPGEQRAIGSYNGEELDAITVDPTTGDVYVLAFDSGTQGSVDTGTGDAPNDTEGDLDLYRIDFQAVYDHWSTNFEGTTVTAGVTPGVGGVAPTVPGGAAAGGFNDYITYGIGIQYGAGLHFDDVNRSHSNTFQLAGSVEKIGEVAKNNTGQGFFDYSLEFVDSDTLLLIDDSSAADSAEDVSTDHAYRTLNRVNTSPGFATAPAGNNGNGGFNNGTTESWESTVIGLVNQDFVGGVATGHSEPESMAYYEDPVSGRRGFWVTESDSSATTRGDDIAFYDIDTNSYAEHAVGGGPTFPTSFALDDDPFVNSSLNDGQADHIFIDEDTGDIIIVESGFGDAGIGTVGADHEPSVIRREVLSYDDGADDRIQFGAWGQKIITTPTKEGNDGAFLERGHWSAYDSENDLVYFMRPDGGSPFQNDIMVLDVNTGITTNFNNIDDSISLFFGDGFGDVADFFFLSSGNIAGDFNGDGMVDGGDYAFWRNNLGGAEPNGSGDGSGLLDAADLQVWIDNFGGGSPGAVASSVSVPEPAAGLTMIVALAGLAIRRRS